MTGPNPAHTSPIIRGEVSRACGTVTARLAACLEAHAEAEHATAPGRARLFRHVARDLRGCQGGDRCGRRFCPACAARRAKRDRRAVEARLAALPPFARLRLLTVTLASPSPREGWRVLRPLLAKLRDRAFFRRAVLGGVFRVETEPARGEDRGWNVHAHGIVELRLAVDVHVDVLFAAWAELRAPSGMPGNVDVQPVTLVWTPHRDRPGERFSPLAAYVTKLRLSTWLDYTAAHLEAAIRWLPGRHEVTYFGAWRKRPAARAVEVHDAG